MTTPLTRACSRRPRARSPVRAEPDPGTASAPAPRPDAGTAPAAPPKNALRLRAAGSSPLVVALGIAAALPSRSAGRRLLPRRHRPATVPQRRVCRRGQRAAGQLRARWQLHARPGWLPRRFPRRSAADADGHGDRGRRVGVTIKTANGDAVTIATDGPTTYHAATAGSASDVTVGATVDVKVTAGGFGGPGNGNRGQRHGTGNGGTAGGRTLTAGRHHRPQLTRSPDAGPRPRSGGGVTNGPDGSPGT